MQIEEILTATPAIPVMVIHDANKAVPLARALVAGGIKVLEVTLRTDAALDAVERIATQVPEATVGVGTLTRPEQFPQAKGAGAQFAVSPGLTNALLNASTEAEIPYLPGVFTASEVMAARDIGFKYLKLFPAKLAGGPELLKILSSVFSSTKFCPTGGMTADTFRDYLALPNVVCVAGAWLVPQDAIADGDWERITRLAAEAMRPAA